MKPKAHFIWIGSDIPNKYKDNIQTFSSQFQIVLHTKELDQMVNIDLYNRMKTNAGKADILRLEILYRYGGLYSDCDSRLLRVFPFSSKLIVCRSPNGYIMNESMYIKEKNSDCFKRLVYGLSDHVNNLVEKGNEVNIWDIAGATYIAPIIRQYKRTEYDYGIFGKKRSRTIIYHSYDASWAKNKNGVYNMHKASKKPLNYWMQ